MCCRQWSQLPAVQQDFSQQTLQNFHCSLHLPGLIVFDIGSTLCVTQRANAVACSLPASEPASQPGSMPYGSLSTLLQHLGQPDPGLPCCNASLLMQELCRLPSISYCSFTPNTCRQHLNIHARLGVCLPVHNLWMAAAVYKHAMSAYVHHSWFPCPAHVRALWPGQTKL